MLDGDQRASLAIVRSLVRGGFPVSAVGQDRMSLAGMSRGARSVQLSADPLSTPRAFAKAVFAEASELGARLLFPVTDASVEAILEHIQDSPRGLCVPYPPLVTYRAASDKLHVHRLASRLGIGVEETHVIQAKDRRAPAEPDLYPGVLKPHRSVVGAGSRIKLSVRFVGSREDCERALEALPSEAFPVLLQRRVIGPGEGVFLARWGGRIIARFAHRRLREKPPAGGVSVFRESIHVDPELMTACESLLEQLDWQGVAMIEGKRDSVRGGWRIMEINGRFWGSLQLAIDAGVDFPRILARAALGEDPEPSPEWRAGVRLRWEWGDVDHLLIRLLRTRERLSLGPDAPSRLAVVRAFMTHHFGQDRLEMLRLEDPMPFVIESLRRFGLSR